MSNQELTEAITTPSHCLLSKRQPNRWLQEIALGQFLQFTTVKRISANFT